jgi:hypothetical protein
MTRARAASALQEEKTMIETKWGNVVLIETLTLTVWLPRDECPEAWRFFHEQVLPFLADRQIPYEMKMTNHYRELDDGDTAHEKRGPRMQLK